MSTLKTSLRDATTREDMKGIGTFMPCVQEKDPMKNDMQLRKDVEQELETDPLINAAGIGVEVRGSKYGGRSTRPYRHPRGASG